MCYEAARSANTPADRSKRATQLSPGAALPASSGPVRIRRTRNRGFGVRDGMPDRAGHDDVGLPYTESAIWCMGWVF